MIFILLETSNSTNNTKKNKQTNKNKMKLLIVYSVTLFYIINIITCLPRRKVSDDECKRLEKIMDDDMYKILILGDMRINHFDSKYDFNETYCA